MQNYGAPYIKACLSLANLFIGLRIWAPDHGRPIHKISKLIYIKFVEVLMGQQEPAQPKLAGSRLYF